MEPLLIYINKIGDIRVDDLNQCPPDRIEWRHIGTIDPKKYLHSILNNNAKLVAALIKEYRI